MKKILWVKFGWSDFYRGGAVAGNFSWLIENKGKKNEARGHEAFNFNRGPNDIYYCYVPPQSKKYAPWNDDSHGWTVVCLAKNPKYKGVHIVGWYENATLHGEWLDPPQEVVKKRGDAKHPAYDWSYCITSKTAYFVPPEFRTKPFSHSLIRQGKYSFLAGPGVDLTNNKQCVLTLLERMLKELAPQAIRNPNQRNAPDPDIDEIDPLKGFVTAEHRKKVEKAAESAVILFYEEKGFECTRVTHLPCGYDFIFSKGRTKVHAEVKGTVASVPRFYLTRNEYNQGMMKNSAWRLAMVTDALSQCPKVCVYKADQVKKKFDLEPYVFIANLVSMVES